MSVSDTSQCQPDVLVSLIEDNKACTALLSEVLAAAPHIHLLATYRSGEEALAELPSLPPHVVLVDLHLPGMSGVDCILRLAPAIPHVAFVVLTAFHDDEAIFHALRAGAVGYLLKTADAADVADAIREARAGGSPMSPGIARKVVRHFHAPKRPVAQAELAQLSTRERSVLDSLASGLRYKEIADLMQLSEDTIRTYVRRTYQKLHVTSRTEAVAKLLRT